MSSSANRIERNVPAADSKITLRYGRNIVYDSHRDGNRNIYAMNLNSHQVTQLTTNPGRDEYPKFSPDGERIAFHSERHGATEIFVMNADGKGQIPVTPQWPQQK